MNLVLKAGQRTVFSILPSLRAIGAGQFGAVKNFHSLCKNTLNPAPRLLGVRQPSIDAERGLKHKGVLQLRCKDCYYVIRKGIKYVMCKSHGRHKQQLIGPKEEDTWILTSWSQRKVRPW